MQVSFFQAFKFGAAATLGYVVVQMAGIALSQLLMSL